MTTSAPQMDSLILGDLTAEELQHLTQLRQQSDQIVHQIGLNRVAEQRLMQQLSQMERSAQTVLSQAGARIGIPDGTPWQVSSEGKAIMAVPITIPPEPSKG